MGFMHSRLWRLVFCMGFKEIHKYLVIYACILCSLDDFDRVLHGFYPLLVFACVLYGFYSFVDIGLCVAWVLWFCRYLIVCCMGFSVLLIFDCVLHGFYSSC